MANEQHSDRGQKSADKSNQQQEQASSGGRSEENARERNQEQANSGREEQPRPAVHNVKSEPHWDPTEPPGGAKGDKSSS